jgi:hypothetical protein
LSRELLVGSVIGSIPTDYNRQVTFGLCTTRNRREVAFGLHHLALAYMA